MRFVVTAAGNFAPLKKLLAMLEAPARKQLLGRIGYLVAGDAKKNARDMHGKAKQKSAMGGGFWASIANSVSSEVASDSVTIGAAHYAAAHKEFGGEIRAPGKGPGSTGAKSLTIPLSFMDRKYRGRSVGELKAQLDIFRRGDILFGREKDTAGTPAMPLFVLKKSVFQKPEPWWPTEDQTFSRISQAIDSMKFGG